MKSILLPLLATAALASERVFSVHDDVLAYPQFEVVYSESFITHNEARAKLREQAQRDSSNAHEASEPASSDLSTYDAQSSDSSTSHGPGTATESYELMTLDERPYLCSIPILQSTNKNETSEPVSETEQQKELASATDRGWELLKDLDGKCLYYISGWWSYSFCYNSQIKQFHQLPPGNGQPIYPPQEDPTTPTYVLGRYGDKKKQSKSGSVTSRADGTELQTKGETRYLVQKLSGGTTCDLTGKSRKIEVQFHCHPQSTDRIGYIKEVTTCTYLMVIYTPRLCNDMAFQPPKDDRPHTISCREVLTSEQVSEWVAYTNDEASRKFLDGKGPVPKVAGNIEIGAKKMVGGDGRRIEKGKAVIPPEERADVVMKKEKGEIRQLSKEDMRKLDIDPEKIDQFRKEIQKKAGDKDWRLEVVDEINGVRHIQAIIESDPTGDATSDSEEAAPEKQADEAGHEGSEEEYKEEL